MFHVIDPYNLVLQRVLQRNPVSSPFNFRPQFFHDSLIIEYSRGSVVSLIFGPSALCFDVVLCDFSLTVKAATRGHFIPLPETVGCIMFDGAPFQSKYSELPTRSVGPVFHRNVLDSLNF